MNKKLLIIGSGGREHALAWKLKQSPRVVKIFVAPGNAGTCALAENVDIKANDVLALADFAEKNNIDFTVVGPDDALALGIVDEFQKRGLKIFGPSQKATQIESSKAFAKELMANNNIPTAEFEIFKDYDKAFGYVEKHFTGVGNGLDRSLPEQNPIVIKASGLALGKGVMVCKTLDEAKNFLADVMQNKIFGDSGNEVVIEQFLEGQEFSVHAFCDGENFVLFPPSQDHKQIFDGNQGPNTGGMGTIAPLPWVSNKLMGQVASKIINPALEGLKNLGSPFVGLLYPGLINTESVVAPFMGLADKPDKSGNYRQQTKVIEFNARFGDPETQSYMRLLKTDLYDILETCVDGNLDKINVEWESKFACCIVLASGGYPGKYEKGLPIAGIEEGEKMEGVIVFHAGTSMKDNQLVTNGGRVLGVTATADDLRSALDKAYAAVKLINFKGMHYRKDIGQKSLISK